MNSEREILKRLLEFESPEGVWSQGKGHYYCTDSSGKKTPKTREQYLDAANKYNKPKGLHTNPSKYTARVLNDKVSEDIYELSVKVFNSVPKDVNPVEYLYTNQGILQGILPKGKVSCNAYASLVSNVLDKLGVEHKIHVGFAVPSKLSKTGIDGLNFLSNYKGNKVANHVWVETDDGTILDTFNGAPAESRRSMQIAYDTKQ